MIDNTFSSPEIQISGISECQSETIKMDITGHIKEWEQIRINEIIIDFLDDKGIEWDNCGFTLIAEYSPDE